MFVFVYLEAVDVVVGIGEVVDDFTGFERRTHIPDADFAVGDGLTYLCAVDKVGDAGLRLVFKEYVEPGAVALNEAVKGIHYLPAHEIGKTLIVVVGGVLAGCARAFFLLNVLIESFSENRHFTAVHVYGVGVLEHEYHNSGVVRTVRIIVCYIARVCSVVGFEFLVIFFEFFFHCRQCIMVK